MNVLQVCLMFIWLQLRLFWKLNLIQFLKNAWVWNVIFKIWFLDDLRAFWSKLFGIKLAWNIIKSFTKPTYNFHNLFLFFFFFLLTLKLFNFKFNNLLTSLLYPKISIYQFVLNLFVTSGWQYHWHFCLLDQFRKLTVKWILLIWEYYVNIFKK